MGEIEYTPEMTNFDRDIAVGNAMIRHGGGFISALGRASLRADPDNLQRIKDAFPEYWEKYSKLADFKIGIPISQR